MNAQLPPWTTYRGNNPRSSAELAAWHAGAPVAEVLEPELPIVDAHHHLFGGAGDALHYRLPDLHADLDSGHRVLGTVYVEAYGSGWRTSGSQALRPVGEVEMIAALTGVAVPTARGDCEVAAGIVAHADLTLGEAVAEVIDAEMTAANGRLSGIRFQTGSVEGVVGATIKNLPRPHLLADPVVRSGLATLGRYDLSFDVTAYHTQLLELADLADAFPDIPMVLNHVGVPIGVAEFSARRAAVLVQWHAGMHALSRRPNVFIKVGGMGMPVFGHGFESGQRPATHQQAAQAWRPYVETCLEYFGSARCMLESAFPVDKQSCSYSELWNAFKLLTRDLSVDERADMFHRTACRVYRLPGLARRAH